MVFVFWKVLLKHSDLHLDIYRNKGEKHKRVNAQNAIGIYIYMYMYISFTINFKP